VSSEPTVHGSSATAGKSVEKSVSDYRRRLRRRQLLDTAARILSEEGADAVRIPRVANLAGVTRPSVYKHFANRQELLLGILEGLGESLDGVLQAFLVEDDHEPGTRLGSVLEPIFDCVAEWGIGAWTLLHSGGPDRESRELSRRILSRFLDPAQKILEKQTGADSTRTGVYCELMVAIFEKGTTQWLEGHLSRGQVVDTIHDACVALIIALANPEPGTLSSSAVSGRLAGEKRD